MQQERSELARRGSGAKAIRPGASRREAHGARPEPGVYRWLARLSFGRRRRKVGAAGADGDVWRGQGRRSNRDAAEPAVGASRDLTHQMGRNYRTWVSAPPSG